MTHPNRSAAPLAQFRSLIRRHVAAALSLSALAVIVACQDALLPTEPTIEHAVRFDTSVGGATVVTDRLDYPPGDTVTITGAGWQPGETVSFVLNEDPAPNHALYSW